MQKSIPVKVALRIRPLIQRELKDGCQSCIRTVSGEPQVILGQDRAFTYDYVFGQTDAQTEVYDNISKELIQTVFKGFNVTILAYGQTGSGKTFTMGGCYESSLSGSELEMGIIPRVLSDIFSGVQERQDTEFVIRVSYMEIYNEEVFDLLCSPNQRDSLSIKEEMNGGIKIPGLKEVQVQGYKETMGLLSTGSEGRTTGSTAMNSTSSRSHAIFTLHVEQRSKTDENDICTMKFQLVDLAGSERCKRTGAEGDRFKEGVNINKGLLVLGNVISALGKKQPHIPYRDAKLTRILQDSLGGNSHTVMIACVSPADTNIEETLNTLRYADRARKIKNKPIINRDPQAAEIMRLKLLVQQLQCQLIGPVSSSTLESSSMSSLPAFDNNTAMVEEMRKLKEENQKYQEETVRLTNELHESLKQRTQMMDYVMRMEAKMERLKENVGIDLDLLSSSMNADNNPKLKAELDKISRLEETIKEDDDEDVDEEEDEETSNSDEADQKENKEAVDDDEMSEATKRDRRATMNLADHSTAKAHLMRQADLHRQLTEVTSMLKEKESLARKMNAAGEEMENMKMRYEQTVSLKQQEIDELRNTQSHAKNNVSKLSEQRRQRLQQLEGEIQLLKKKMTEQNKVLKLKQSSDTQLTKLNNEVQAMKQQRVRLVKQMKEETVSFQKWKREKEKEVNKLKQKDTKREFKLKKLQNEFDKQQTVLKRKNAEAMAANKRLKDALSKRNEITAEKTKKLEKCDATSIGNRVRKWLGHELDLRFSMTECKFHLEELMENRKELTQRLQMLSEQLEEGPLMEKFSWLGDAGDPEDIGQREEEIKKQMTGTQMDIDMINVQITELQQKIVETDQDLKGTSTWQSLHTMTEAKCALKFLLEQAIGAKAEHSRARTELKNVEDHGKADVSEKEDTVRGLETAVRDLKSSMSQLKNKHEREIGKLKNECEEKVLFLLSADHQSNSDTPKGTPKGVSKKGEMFAKEKIKILESQVKNIEEIKTKLDETQWRLQDKEKECETLKRNVTCGMLQTKQYNLFPDVTQNSSPFLNPTLKKAGKKKPSPSSSLNSTFTMDTIGNDNDDDQTQEELPPSSPTPLFPPPPPCPSTVTITKSKTSRVTRSSNSSSDENAAVVTSPPSQDTSLDSSTAGVKRKSGNKEGSDNLDTTQERKKKRKRTLLSQDIVYNFSADFGNL